jgi:porphobilinogen synthase
MPFPGISLHEGGAVLNDPEVRLPVNSDATFPVARPRRLRRSPALRAMVRETELTPADFIYPLFIRPGKDGRREIRSMPGVFQWTVAALSKEVENIAALGIPAVILFGIPEQKDPIGRENFAPDGVVQRAIRAIKKAVPELIVITDVCMCEYTDHGHCGLLNLGDPLPDPSLPEGYVLNDPTLNILGKVAVSHAQAGADIVAPSGMMDGMVGSIRRSLDAHHFENIAILSYAVKYASSFYGPFRDAAESPPQFGDRKSHQMDPANAREALHEADLDVSEGADMLMVKPALPYLDVIYRVHDRFPQLPLGAYNVSGEYAMIKAAAERGWLDERKTVLEALTGIKRAGADLILTYHAKDAAGWLAEESGKRGVQL